jgi:pyruvate,water dikinase
MGEPSMTGELRGLAASPGVVEGPARFVSSPDEFSQIEPGDILVCRMTNPAWVVAFTKIGGLITEAGGTTSHPAVVAREFGIPAVVGAHNASERVQTGDRVRLNGSSGLVEILS